jgi:hypothetical protein
MRLLATAITAVLCAFAVACEDEGGGPESTATVERPTAGPTEARATSPAGGVWSPAPGTTWQWQLQGDIDTSLDVAAYDIDLFDVPQATIDTLHAEGRTVICYFSAGSLEEGRPDEGEFAPDDAGDQLENWPDERWLDVRSANVRRVTEQRLDLALAKGCDAVEPDNVDAYDNNNGFDLTEADQLDFNRFLAEAAHARGLSVGLKNALGLVEALEPSFDWALNEECVAYEECEALAPFIDAGKAVFHVEYVDDEDGEALHDEACADPTIAGFSTLTKTPDLEVWRLAC